MKGSLDYVDREAIAKLRQTQINNIMADSFKLNREVFGEFLPTGIERIRIIPGREAQELQVLTALVYGEANNQNARVQEWFRDHNWKRVWITDEKSQRTADLSMVEDHLIEYILFDEDGFLYYMQDDRGRPANPPKYLQWDIYGIRHYITTKLGIMSAIKNEELIANTLEGKEGIPATAEPTVIIQEDER